MNSIRQIIDDPNHIAHVCVLYEWRHYVSQYGYRESLNAFQNHVFMTEGYPINNGLFHKLENPPLGKLVYIEYAKEVCQGLCLINIRSWSNYAHT